MAFIAIPSPELRWLVPDADLSAAFAMAISPNGKTAYPAQGGTWIIIAIGP